MLIFSIERARAETSDLPTLVGGIAAVEAIDDHTVRITTAAPDPSLWLKLVDVAIMSRAWAERHGVTTPADYNRAREETYASRHANGTGPFMVEAFEPRGEYVLVRNAAWWGTADYPHNIDRIVHTHKGGDTEKLAALIKGKIDLLQAPPYSALDQILRTPGLKLAHRTALITLFLGLDQGSPELRSSNIKGHNPFKDKRVRQAISYAIDVEAILGDFMGELLVPAGMLLAPGVNGYSAELDEPPPSRPRTGQGTARRGRLPVARDCCGCRHGPVRAVRPRLDPGGGHRGAVEETGGLTTARCSCGAALSGARCCVGSTPNSRSEASLASSFRLRNSSKN